MTDKVCPDCSRPIALSYEAWMAHRGTDDEHLSCAAHTNLDDEDMWADESIPDCRMATITRQRSELSALRLEVSAWRALAEHGAFTDLTVSRPWAIANGRWRMSCSAIIAEAATPGEVAIDLARKLQLIPAEPDAPKETP